MAERYDVQGKVVFITGGARGIGAALGKRLAAKGANVALVGLEPAELAQRVAEIGEQRAIGIEADVTDLAAIEHAVAQTVERFGGIDVAVANAGVAPFGSIAGIDPEVFDRTIAVNLGGVFRTLRATHPHVTARQGYFLPIASLAAVGHAPLMSAYAASKAATEALGNVLRQEVAHTGAKVGVAYFSFIDTDMVSRGFDRPSAQMAKKRAGGPLSRTAPLSAAIDAVERGIERRARTVVCPRWVSPILRLRGFTQPLQEREVARKGFGDIVEQADREASALTTVQPDGVGAEPRVTEPAAS
jgi:NAD(P)-dependent dehydrogenase (short-subunit alcohol dehydrogenase family)